MSFQVCGIYKIENLVNAKKYIGQSVNILRRFDEHKRPSKRINPTKELYIAFNEFGIENFSFETIEECDKESLNEREKYWIEYYDSINNGYNMSIIQNLQQKFSSEEVQEIQKQIILSKDSNRTLAKKYGVSDAWISLVNKGELWHNKSLSYPLRKRVKSDNKKDKNKNKSLFYSVRKKAKSDDKKDKNNSSNNHADYPNRETLKALIRTVPFTKIGIKYGVIDNAIRKWCDKYSLPRKKSIIKKYSDSEWELI